MADDSAELLLDFTNTHDDRFGRVERFGDADGLSRWLSGNGFAGATAGVTAADAAAARELRDDLITILLGHSRDPATSTETLAEAEKRLRRTAVRYPLVTVPGRDGARLAPAQDGLPGVLGSVLAAVTELALAGNWGRLKACRNCRFTFYDRTRNGSGAYCSATCGTQVGMRNYRQRHRASLDGEGTAAGIA